MRIVRWQGSNEVQRIANVDENGVEVLEQFLWNQSASIKAMVEAIFCEGVPVRSSEMRPPEDASATTERTVAKRCDTKVSRQLMEN